MTHRSFSNILAVYQGSNGDATKAMYEELNGVGAIGIVAVNVFRAHKTSGRAKVYRGRRYRDASYDTKTWSITNLSVVLTNHAETLGIRWGWKEDPSQATHRWVFYVDLPTGQVSFHTAERGNGPDYPGEWDRVRGMGPDRICRWIAAIFKEHAGANV